MALINCPECNKEISDKAEICIHCGYPIKSNKEINMQLYKIQFKKFCNHSMYSKNRLKVVGFVNKIYNKYEPYAEHINLNKEYIIFDGISKKSAELVKRFFESKGCIIEILHSNFTNLSEIDKKIISVYEESVIRCPTCGSTNTEKISATSKVVGAATFGIFSKTAKSQFKCNHCGYKW